MAAATAVGHGILVGGRLLFRRRGGEPDRLRVGCRLASQVSWRQVVSGLDQIAWGMVFFVLAALIGVPKTGA